MFQVGSFVLTPEEVAKRKQYLEITPRDEQLLKDAHPHLVRQTPGIIERFYEYLLSHEHTREMLSAPGLVDRLKVLQTKYFIELTSGVYDLAYFENRLRVGQVHHRIGLSPEWYMGAYVKYLHIASDVLSTVFGRDYERYFQTIVSLTKVISLDKALAIDAYHHAAQEALEKTNEELRRTQAAKRQLTDMIVHDLQNPLAGMSAAIQVVSSGESLSESARGALVEARRRCQDLAEMIMNVLQVSRAETGELQTYVENVDLSQIARDVAGAFQVSAQLEGRSISVEVPDRTTIRSDQTLLRRILQNLIRNALRHTPNGTRVVVKIQLEGPERLRVSVADDGPGIPKDVQANLFEPFSAAALRKSGIRVDSGLGLPSCRVMARAIAAELRVDSDGSHGSTFSLLLPERMPETKPSSDRDA
jgi:signal transduction histidine kinase